MDEKTHHSLRKNWENDLYLSKELNEGFFQYQHCLNKEENKAHSSLNYDLFP